MRLAYDGPVDQRIGEEHAVTRPPTAAQRRVIDAADPVTGRLRGTEAQLAALVKRGLAFRHPRPPHDHLFEQVEQRHPARHAVRGAVADLLTRLVEVALEVADAGDLALLPELARNRQSGDPHASTGSA